jgi:hypothetical protein
MLLADVWQIAAPADEMEGMRIPVAFSGCSIAEGPRRPLIILDKKALK